MRCEERVNAWCFPLFTKLTEGLSIALPHRLHLKNHAPVPTGTPTVLRANDSVRDTTAHQQALDKAAMHSTGSRTGSRGAIAQVPAAGVSSVALERRC